MLIRYGKPWKALQVVFLLYLVNLRTCVLCFDTDTSTASLNCRSSQCDLILLLSCRNEILFLPLVSFTWKCIYTVCKETSMSITFPCQTAACLIWCVMSNVTDDWAPDCSLKSIQLFTCMHAMYIPLCVFVFLCVGPRGPYALHAFGVLFICVLYLNRSLPFNNRELPVCLS